MLAHEIALALPVATRQTGKKVKGVKCNALVDKIGSLLGVEVIPARSLSE
jgi:hypothetical protein